MTNQIDFLIPGTTQIRHQIKNIVESYNHDWDLVAELAQNSVDAISVQNPIRGHIVLTVSAIDKKLTIEDNGCGIPPDELPGLLTPFSTGKYENPSLIGQKGVGISFAIFSSATFFIESHHIEGSCRASIDGANSWLDSDQESLPKLEFEEIPSQKSQGTRIEIKLPSESENNFFEYSFNQLAMVLLTRTAIGDTQTIWRGQVDKSVQLTLNNLSGETEIEEFDCSYLLPITRLRKSAFISLRDYQDWNTGEKTDAEKRRKLAHKIIYHDDETYRSGRNIRFWACLVPKRKWWDIISNNSKIVSDEILNIDPDERAARFGNADYLFSGGMYTSTKGMPTGIRSEMIVKGWAGYLPNFFIIIDDPNLSFDIGRKSIPSRQLGMLRDIASDVFQNFRTPDIG